MKPADLLSTILQLALISIRAAPIPAVCPPGVHTFRSTRKPCIMIERKERQLRPDRHVETSVVLGKRMQSL